MRYSIVLLLGLCLAFNTLSATVVVTNGLTHKYEMTSGTIQNGYVMLKNISKSSQRVLIYKNDLNVGCESEQLDVGKAASGARSNAGWIKLAAEERLLAPGEEYSLRYEINAPEGKLSGTYWSLIMVEVKKPIDTTSLQSGIQVTSNVRYAVQVITDFQTSIATDVKFDGVEYVNTSQGKAVSVRLSNRSDRMVQPMVKLEVYNENGEITFSSKAESKKLYPEQCRNFIVPINDLPSGKYQAVLVADCGESDLFGMTINLEVDE